MNNVPSVMNPIFESVLNSKFNHAKYGLKPQHRVLSQVVRFIKKEKEKLKLINPAFAASYH